MGTKIGFLTAALALVLFTGCRKESKIVEFDIEYKQDFVVPANTFTVWAAKTVSASVATDIATKLDTYNTNNERVGEIKVSAFKLAVKSPASKDLNFVKSVVFDIKATDHTDVQVSYLYNSGNKQDATRDTIKPNVKTADLHLNEPNIKNYIMEPSFDLKMKLEPYSTQTSSMTLTASFTVHVKGIEKVN